MTRIMIVRHGRAAASYTDDMDPGLDDLGQRQAEAVADKLSGMLSPETSDLNILSSPLKRARETAAPLLARTGGELGIEDRVSEIPSPGLSLEERGPWLRGVMTGRWSEQSPDLIAWRRSLTDCLIQQPADCVIFSHFVAINVVTGFAEGRDEVTIFRPDNASITILETNGSALSLIQRGDEAVTTVN